MTRSSWLRCLAAFTAAWCQACSPTTAPTLKDLDRIGGGIWFEVVETHLLNNAEVLPPKLALYVETLDTFPCTNYFLKSEFGIQGESVSLELIRIKKPSACLTAIGPARMRFLLPQVEGEFTLSFSFGNVTDEYQLSVSKEAIELGPSEGSFTTRRDGRRWRYPPHSFSLVCDLETSGENGCTELTAFLRDTGELTEVFFPQGGVNPYSLYLDEPGRDWRVSYFQMGEGLDFATVKSAFCSFSFSNDQLHAYVLSWENEAVHTWTLGRCPAIG